MTDTPTQSTPAAPAAPALGTAPAGAAADAGATSGDPEPRATFDALPLSPEVRRAIDEMGYVHPTPVQLAMWEPATRGRDAVVQARTGTGKTAAFGLPIVDHLVKRSLAHPQVLVLSPTRELALQIARELERIAKHKNVAIASIYGGAPMQRQIDTLAGGAQVIVGTPGRVLDHLRRGTLDPKGIRLLVLDECDEMLSMGFERELTAILEHLPASRQTLLFSATLPPDIERIARQKLRSPEFLTLSGDHIGALSIRHFVYMVAADKPGALLRVLEVENPESALIFCNTRDETEAVAQLLERQGFDADWLNGDLPQADREKVMAKTREGRLRFLVATDVAARGIDLSHLTHVINYDFPQDAETYVHRTGRTGRAGRTGTAISLVTPHDVGALYLLRLTYKIRPIEKPLPTAGELKAQAEADLLALLAEQFAAARPDADDLALARRLLTLDDVERIVAGLLRDYLATRPRLQEQATAARRARAALVRQQAASEERKPAAAGEPQAGQASEERAARRPPPPTVQRPDRDRHAAAEPAAGHAGPERERERARDRGERGDRGERDRGRERDRGFERDRRRGRGPEAPGREGAPRGETGSGSGRTGAPQPADASEGASRREATGERVVDEEAETLRRPSLEPIDGANAWRSGRAPRAEKAADAPRAAERVGGAPRAAAPERRARPVDFTTWQPPEEEGDDEPILPSGHDRSPERPLAAGAHGAAAPPAEAGAAARDADFVDVYVNAGRRDGVRASDVQRVLDERAGFDRAYVRRIRVRDRHTFVSVKRAHQERAIAALTGATLAGKVASAELARERSGAGPTDAAADAAIDAREAGSPGDEPAPNDG